MQAYGPAGAACLMPLTFRLPAQLREWRQWMAANPCGAAPGAGGGREQEQGEGEGQRLWMLKTAQHLGKGLQLVTQEAALAAVLQRQADVLSYKTETEEMGRSIAGVGATSSDGSGGGSCSSSSGGGGLPSRGKRDPDRPRPFVLAQRYVEDPLLIGGRKFGIRVWAVVLSGTVAPAATGAGAAAAGGGGVGVEARAGGVGLSAKEAEAEGHEAQEPLRVYLHENGLVLFATEAYEGGSSEVGSGGAGSEGGEDVDGLGEGTLPHPVAAAASASPAAVIAEQGGDDGEEWVEGEDEEQGEEEDDDDDEEEEAEDTYTPTAMQRLGLATMTAVPPSPSPRSFTPSPSTSAFSSRSCEVPLGHVTNYAQNVDGIVWSLEQLGEHLGQERFGLLIRRLRRSAALTLAAALPHVRSETARLRRRGVRSGWPLGAEEAGGCSGGCGTAAAGADGGTNASGGCFELLGLDYLVDSNMR
ncbi:hypothetical protein Agub_g2981, partial [Astrephomene gubernaculifera]